MLISKEVEINITGKNYARYTNLGYDIPKKYKWGKWSIPENTKVFIKIKDLSPSSHVKILCKCDGCGKETYTSYQNYFSHKKEDKKTFCISCKFSKNFYSFGEWMIDNGIDIEKYWSKKNKVDPFSITFSSRVTGYFICQKKEYHKEYKKIIYSFVNGKRCPFCSGNKVHIFDSLASIFPESLNYWSDKNKKTAFEYSPQSHSVILWKCLKSSDHEDFERKIQPSVTSEFRCPKCVAERTESLIQEKVRLYLESLNYTILHEHKCTLRPRNPKTNHFLNYDNEILELNLLIETHGSQHYGDKMRYYKSENNNKKYTDNQFEDLKFRDDYKKQYALDNGYYFLEIPYWLIKTESYKKLIDDKIKEIEGEIYGKIICKLHF